MKKIANRSALLIQPVSLLALALFVFPSRSVWAQSQDVQVIQITAKKCQYSVSPVQVKVGSKVKLKITAIDHDHGFRIAWSAKVSRNSPS